MCSTIETRSGAEAGGIDLGGECKMRLDEALERRRRLRVSGVVLRQDDLRCGIRYRVRKRLAVLVDRFGLDRDEQILEQHLRRIRIRRRRTRCRLRRTDGQQRQQERHEGYDLAEHQHQA